MINRILIRIKVVQILYSYLLSLSEFKIEKAPENASRDRRFAYAVYLDMLMLIQSLSGLRVNNSECKPSVLDINKSLKNNQVGKALADDIQLKEITFKNAADYNLMSPLFQELHDEVVKSAIFAEYSKKRSHKLEDDVRLWTVLLETTILKNQKLSQALRANPDFSLTGLNRGVMSAVDTLKAYNDSTTAIQTAKNELLKSLDQSYKLYLALFRLIVELTDEQSDRFEVAKGKYLATAEDLNPNTKLVDNRFVKYLRENELLNEFVKNEKFTWVDAPGLLKNLLDNILASDIYADYMQSPTSDWQSDCEFWRSVLRNIVLSSDQFADSLEAKSIYWNDDISIVGTFVLKTIRRFALSNEGEGVDFLPQYKDEEDAEYGLQLFNLTVKNRDLYRSYINQFINADWDPDRLAFMDIVVMMTAIAEILNFDGIPVPVSLNEYIEIANNYSTSSSGAFINGILYSVSKMLIDEGTLRKPLTLLSNKPAEK